MSRTRRFRPASRSSGWGGRITDLLQSQNSGSDFPADHDDRRVRTFLHGAADVSGYRSAAVFGVDRGDRDRDAERTVELAGAGDGDAAIVDVR